MIRTTIYKKLVILFILGFTLSNCTNSEDNQGSASEFLIDTKVEVKKKFYEDGQLKSISPVNQSGLKDGEVVTYYPNGNVLNKANYKNGIRVGKNLVYFENSRVKIKEYYNDEGLVDGSYEEFFENGQLNITGQFKRGLKEGVWKEFYENGNLYEENFFELNQLDGMQKVYHPNGILGVIGRCRNDKEIGDWIFYGIGGDTLKIETYEDGIVVDKKVYKKSKRVKNG